jgi:hypothetical protein
MTTKFLKILFSALLLSAVSTGYAQEQSRIGCMDKAIRMQAEQAKQDFIKQGMKVYKEAMISMESLEPFPIAVQLTKGELYQIVYIGSMSASKMRFELLDGADKKIDERTQAKPIENNAIIYSFVPDKSDVYLLMLTQKTKRPMCGSIAIMQKGDKKPAPAPKK